MLFASRLLLKLSRKKKNLILVDTKDCRNSKVEAQLKESRDREEAQQLLAAKRNKDRSDRRKRAKAANQFSTIPQAASPPVVSSLTPASFLPAPGVYAPSIAVQQVPLHVAHSGTEVQQTTTDRRYEAAIPMRSVDPNEHIQLQRWSFQQTIQNQLLLQQLQQREQQLHVAQQVLFPFKYM